MKYTQEKIQAIVEALRTADADLVYAALTHAPTETLLAMRDMIGHILTLRDKLAHVGRASNGH